MASRTLHVVLLSLKRVNAPALFYIGALVMATVTSALAQTSPIALPPAAAPLAAPPIPRVLPPEQPEVQPAPAQPSPPPAPPEGAPVRVDEVHFEGVTVYNQATLQALAAGAVGTEVPRAKLDEIARALQTKYREDGYILTVVHGSFEGTKEHVVFVVRAVEGYIGEVKLQNDIGPAGLLVYKILEHLTEKRPVNNSDLERAILLSNDVPGVTVKAVLRHESAEPGSIELIAELSRKKFSGFLDYDNRGSPEAGPNEMLVSGSTNSFTSLGEQFQALMFTTFNREQIFGQVNADTFLFSDGLHLHTYFGAGNNQPGGILANTGYNGDLSIGGGELSYPLVRSRRFNWYINGDVDKYDSNISIGSTGNLTLSASHLLMGRLGSAVDVQDALLFDFPAATSFHIKVSRGLVGTSDTRPSNDVHFNKVSGDLTRVQNLWNIGEVGTALKLAIGGQYSDDILPTSEKFYFGGNQWGRGFWNGEITGDRALATTIEAEENYVYTGLPFLGDDEGKVPAQFYQFWDYGRSYNLGSGDLDTTIQSLGLGLRTDLKPWFTVDVEGVHRLTTHAQTGAPVDGAYGFLTQVSLHY
ncbi:MAG TPA: ShlB/FhaC/HecB family hemolysin secretion/activation protein [Stellaceae bacterium]|nr:ShlB/FhaC/HecB family hemolysin secretion/activation protein [Stellaceae bacterium]